MNLPDHCFPPNPEVKIALEQYLEPIVETCQPCFVTPDVSSNVFVMFLGLPYSLSCFYRIHESADTLEHGI